MTTQFKPPTPKTTPDRVVEVPRTVVPDTHDADPELIPPFDDLDISKNRVDWREEEFRRVIRQHGKHVVWRKALLCPCHDEQTGQAQINCENCDGSGFYYIDALKIQALMFNQDKHTKLYEKFGMWLQGETSVTVEPENRLGYRDSLELRDSVMTFTELIKKNNRRGARSKLPAGYDSARYRIVSMTRMMLATGLSTSGCASTVSLECDKHFTISDDGWIKWTADGNTLVPDGHVLSVRYEFHPVWIVESFPHAMRDDISGRKTDKSRVIGHPLQAAAKLDYLLDVNTPAPTTG